MSLQNQLKSSNLSVTSVCVALLESLDVVPHFDAHQVFDLVKARIKTTSIQAIYKNLNILIERRLIRDINSKSIPATYEMRVGDNHHHLMRRVCSKICDTDCLGPASSLISVNSEGFKIDEAEIIFGSTYPKYQLNYNKGENGNDTNR